MPKSSFTPVQRADSAIKSFEKTLNIKAYTTSRNSLMRAAQRAEKAGNPAKALGFRTAVAKMPTPAQMAKRALHNEINKVEKAVNNLMEAGFKKQASKRAQVLDGIKRPDSHMTAIEAIKQAKDLRKSTKDLDLTEAEKLRAKANKAREDGFFVDGDDDEDLIDLEEKALDMFNEAMKHYRENSGAGFFFPQGSPEFEKDARYKALLTEFNRFKRGSYQQNRILAKYLREGGITDNLLNFAHSI